MEDAGKGCRAEAKPAERDRVVNEVGVEGRRNMRGKRLEGGLSVPRQAWEVRKWCRAWEVVTSVPGCREWCVVCRGPGVAGVAGDRCVRGCRGPGRAGAGDRVCGNGAEACADVYEAVAQRGVQGVAAAVGRKPLLPVSGDDWV